MICSNDAQRSRALVKAFGVPYARNDHGDTLNTADGVTASSS
jgi:hypothetical protein